MMKLKSYKFYVAICLSVSLVLSCSCGVSFAAGSGDCSSLDYRPVIICDDDISTNGNTNTNLEVSLSDEPLSLAAEESLLEARAIADKATKAIGAQADSLGETPQDGNIKNAFAASGLNYSVTERNGQTFYTFEGKEYTLGDSYGIHKISGYSGAETGYNRTYSGKVAMSRHTLAAASDLPIGTVLIITGVQGPSKDLYNGMYVVEDRGGYYLESEGWLDIYFDTYEEAISVSNYGWNYAEAFIAVPVG